MHIMSDTMIATQKEQPLWNLYTGAGAPLVRVEFYPMRGCGYIFSWSRLYSGLYEYYIIGDDDIFSVGGDIWACQTFTPQENHTIGCVKIKAHRQNSPGTVYVAIRATDEDGKPTGPDLTTGSFNGNLITEGAWADWIPCALTPYALSASTKYAIVIRAPDAGGVNLFYLHLDTSGASYARGIFGTSANAGTSWTLQEGVDLVFECWAAGTPGAGDLGPHAAAMPADGSLVRARIDAGTNDLFRQRVASPDEDSDYSPWTDTNQQAIECAATANSTEVLLFYIEPSAPFHIYRMTSNDSGASFGAPVDTNFVSDANGRLAACHKSNGDVGLVYSRAHRIYAARRVSDAWGAEQDSAKTLTALTGLAVYHMGDWNMVVTGENTANEDGAFRTLLGDGYSQAVGTWVDLADIIKRESTEDYEYAYPCLAMPGVFRTFFVEKYTEPTQRQLMYFSHTTPTSDFIDNLWLEPVPFNHYTHYGMALVYKYPNAWLTTPDGVWTAITNEPVYNVSSDVIALTLSIDPKRSRSKCTVVVDNTAGKYNAFNKKGWQLRVCLGYNTEIGHEWVPQQFFQVTGWSFHSPGWFPLRAMYPPGILGTLSIEAEGMYDMLKRWKARRLIKWNQGDKNIFQMLTWIFARIGMEFSAFSYSSDVTLMEPEFTIREGQSGLWAVKKLLSWVQCELIQESYSAYLVWPRASDASNYEYSSKYGEEHLVFRGQYGTGLWDPNAAQVWGDGLMEEGFEFAEVEKGYDRLSNVTKPDYDTAEKAALRVTTELRKGQIYKGSYGWMQVPINCGQESFDVVTITDYTAGVSAIKRRVIAITTRYNKRNLLFQQIFKLGAL